LTTKLQNFLRHFSKKNPFRGAQTPTVAPPGAPSAIVGGQGPLHPSVGVWIPNPIEIIPSKIKKITRLHTQHLKKF